jgi:hypothetical protein
MQGPEQMMTCTPSNISYLTIRSWGTARADRDAAMFGDPIFSAGVTLATRAGLLG